MRVIYWTDDQGREVDQYDERVTHVHFLTPGMRWSNLNLAHRQSIRRGRKA